MQIMKKYQLELFCFEVGSCDNHVWVDLGAVSLPAALLEKMSDLGIIEIKGKQMRADHICRAYKAVRLHRALGVNLNGTAIILDLLDRMEELHEELLEALQQQRR